MPNPFEIRNLNRRKIASGKNLQFEEAFMDLQNEDSEVLDDDREHLNYWTITGVMLICLLVLFGRIGYLQIVRGQEYRSLAEGNKLRVQYVLAPRGLLTDSTGKVIAGNIPSFELVVVTSDLPKDPSDYEAKVSQVAQIIGKDPLELTTEVSTLTPNSYQAQTLAENITKDQALIIISKQAELKGFIVQNNAIRDYKDPLAFSHLVGYTGKITADELDKHKDDKYVLNDYIGKTGIEVQYEQYLRGILGQRQVEIDAQGNFKRALADVPAVPGNDVKLNIDYDLQKKIYDSLTAAMSRIRATRGAAVATNPKTGEVLAILSLPSFDNNMFARGINQDEYSKLLNDSNNPLLDRSISGTYPPGSTVKPMMAVAALSEGVVKPDTKILDDGVIRIGAYTFYGYEHSGLGIMNVYSAIARSSDIYFYTVGGGNAKTSVKEGLGPDRIAKWLRKFQMGGILGIDLPNEKPGLVPDPAWKKQAKNEPWYLGDTYHYAIGQGDLLVTPLQVNSWTATIANGGKVMQPRILNQVTDKNGKVIVKTEPKVLAEIFSAEGGSASGGDPNIIKIVQDGMRQTVTVGTARSLNALPMEVSGKTGTAQFDARNLSRTHAWFTSYAPSNDPQIALTILIEAGGEGSSVSVPVTKEVLAWWAENRYKK